MKKWLSSRAEQYENASKWTGFHDTLRDEILFSLNAESLKNKTLIDVGCGIGIIDRKLSQDFENIITIYKDRNAIMYLNKKINEEKISNIKPITKRWEQIWNQYKNNKRDILLLSFFADPRIEDMDKLFSMAKEKAIIITNTKIDLRQNDSIEREKRIKERANNCVWIDYLEKKLNDKNSKECRIKTYSAKELIYDFGQPLRSKNEAFFFIQDYYEIEIVKKRIKDLEKTNDNEFPYFLPKTKFLSLIIIDFNKSI